MGRFAQIAPCPRSCSASRHRRPKLSADCAELFVEIKMDPATAEKLKTEIPVYDQVELTGVSHKVVLPVKATACKHLLWDPSVTQEDVIAQLRFQARTARANGIMDVTCSDKEGMSLTKNRWESITCSATAVHVRVNGATPATPAQDHPGVRRLLQRQVRLVLHEGCGWQEVARPDVAGFRDGAGWRHVTRDRDGPEHRDGGLDAGGHQSGGAQTPMSSGRLSPRDLCSGVTLAPTETCPVGVRFKPASVRPQNALVIPSNDFNESAVTRAPDGTGL
jgi:hypothetical protein